MAANMAEPLAEIVELLRSEQLEVGAVFDTYRSLRTCSKPHRGRTVVGQVRKGAARIVEGLTGSPEGLQQLMSSAENLLPALLRRLSDDPAVSRAVLTALVNLTQASQQGMST